MPAQESSTLLWPCCHTGYHDGDDDDHCNDDDDDDDCGVDHGDDDDDDDDYYYGNGEVKVMVPKKLSQIN